MAISGGFYGIIVMTAMCDWVCDVEENQIAVHVAEIATSLRSSQ